MVNKKIIIENKFGFHLRPAAAFCKKSRLYESNIQFIRFSKKTPIIKLLVL